MENENKYIHTKDLDIEYIESYLEDCDIVNDDIMEYAIENISIHELTKDNKPMKKRLLQDLKNKIKKDNANAHSIINQLNHIVIEYNKFQEELNLKIQESLFTTRSPFYLEFRARFP